MARRKRRGRGVGRLLRGLHVSPWHAGTRPALREKSEVATLKVEESGSGHSAQET